MAPLDRGKPLRAVLRWQFGATVVAALIAGYWFGPHGAASAVLGGLINIVAGAAFVRLALGGESKTAGMALYAVFRAEAGKVLLIIVQLWLALTLYKQLVPVVFFGTFFLTVILSTMAFIARDR